MEGGLRCVVQARPAPSQCSAVGPRLHSCNQYIRYGPWGIGHGIRTTPHNAECVYGLRGGAPPVVEQCIAASNPCTSPSPCPQVLDIAGFKVGVCHGHQVRVRGMG